MEREQATRSLRGIYVLVVDDHVPHRDLLRDVLRYCGAWVSPAVGPDQALAVLREAMPTVLVIVVRPPGEEAWRLLRGIRAMPPEHGGKMPVVGIGPSALAGLAREQRIDAYLAEPIEALVLCRTIVALTE